MKNDSFSYKFKTEAILIPFIRENAASAHLQG